MDSNISGKPIIYKTLLGIVIGTVRKTDKAHTFRKLSFQRSGVGTAKYTLRADSGTSPVLIGMQSHLSICVLSVSVLTLQGNCCPQRPKGLQSLHCMQPNPSQEKFVEPRRWIEYQRGG